MQAKDMVSKKKIGILAAISAAIVVALLLFWFWGGGVKSTLEEQTLTVRGYTHSYTLSFSDMDEVYLLSHFNDGSSKMFSSVETYRSVNGNFSTAGLGEYRLDRYKRVERYIRIDAKGKTYVVNCSDEESTEEMYKAIVSHLNK